jgi:YD repeat-containing protein
MRSRLVELILLMLAVAMGMRLWAPRPQPTVSATPSSLAATPSSWKDNRINGIGYHDTMDSAETLLGVAPCKGPLKVGKHGEEDGFYEEWGGSKTITWTGSPTLTFYADKGLLCSIGNVLSLGRSDFGIGSSRGDIEAHFGPPTTSENTGDTVTCSYQAPDQNLHLTYDAQGRLIKILRESLR